MAPVIKKQGLLLKKMLDESLIIDLNNSKQVKLSNIKFTVSAKGRKAVLATCQTVTEDKAGNVKMGDKHKCSIIGLENDGLLSKQRCMVSCSCSRFLYYFEVALAAKGAAKIKYSDGSPPHVTNPNMITGMCKHLIALSKYLIKNKQ
jgi:hypothetical protein